VRITSNALDLGANVGIQVVTEILLIDNHPRCGGAKRRCGGGVANPPIAHKLVSESTTVKSHLQHISERLGVLSRYSTVAREGAPVALATAS
jgi:hypothetical protein